MIFLVVQAGFYPEIDLNTWGGVFYEQKVIRSCQRIKFSFLSFRLNTILENVGPLRAVENVQKDHVMSLSFFGLYRNLRRNMDTQNDANISKKVFPASDFMASFLENLFVQKLQGSLVAHGSDPIYCS